MVAADNSGRAKGVMPETFAEAATTRPPRGIQVVRDRPRRSSGDLTRSIGYSNLYRRVPPFIPNRPFAE